MNPALALTFRPARPDDAAFLVDLYVTTRDGEFLFLDDAQRRQLLEWQCAAQQSSYVAQFPGSEHRIIECGEEAAGRIWTAATIDSLRIVDISLLPRFRRQGIGTAVYRAVLGDAAARQARVTASVHRSNAASLRFHAALGFTIAGESEVYYALAYGDARRD